jgi:cytochrome c biogenesis protein CcmG/thiol:disulfide interchange protein DsbE
VAFVGIDVQDLRTDALAFLREFDVPYVSVRDRDNEVFEAYGVTGVPETYYLDQRGRIVSHTPGAITRDTLEAGIGAALRGAP